MLFSDPEFLFFFLPIVLLVSLIAPKRLKNMVLLAASLLFYAAGEGAYFWLMVISIVFNYILGLVIQSSSDSHIRKIVLTIGVAANLMTLAWFKYIGFLVENVNGLLATAGLGHLEAPQVHLPAGISFFTFHSISYVVDIYRRDVSAIRNPLDFGLYISFFPQLIAGPIVRFKTIASQIADRSVRMNDFAEGTHRFIIGLGKKLIIADLVGAGADKAFNAQPNYLTSSLAWLGLLCYALQIYYDFSGYSDMAIGMARMLGFRFLENFRYPYFAQSVTEFWRRWHISLSTWFRDYLYIPLGGNRVRRGRMYFNLFVVFLLCGIWHGASWTFVVWGLWHGAFLIIERAGLGPWIKRRNRFLRHGYALIVTMLAWVLFRSTDFSQALIYFKALFGFGAKQWMPTMRIEMDLILAIIAGVFFAAPTAKWIKAWWTRRVRASGRYGDVIFLAGRAFSVAAMAVTFLLSVMQAAAGTHNPFIYFRF